MNYRLLYIFFLLFVACTKDNKEDTDIPPSDGYKVQAVTRIDFTMPNASGNATRLIFRDKTITLGVYNINSSGEYRFEFHGKDGRQMLQGDPRNSGTESARWNINTDDTIKVYKNNVLYRDFVTQTEDGINDGINIDFISGTSISSVKSNANVFVSPGGALSQMKFKLGL